MDTCDVKAKGCDNCPFNSRKIGNRGPEDSRFVIVGESPGANELATGMPFMGPNGKMLMDNLPLDVEPLYMTALSCFPTKKDPDILANAVQCCSNRLHTELMKHPRDVIVALGNGALWGLTGDYNLKITQCRGHRFETPLAKHGIIAAVHPAFLLRGMGSYKKFQEDLDMAVNIYKGTPTKHYIEPVTRLITKDNAKWLAGEIKRAGIVASDIETGGLNRRKDKILTTGFCFDPRVAWICPPELIPMFKDVMEDPEIKWIWHNGKFDIAFLRRDGYNARVDEDTMLLNYALDETRGVHDLDTVASDVLSAPTHKHIVDNWFEEQGIPKSKRDYSTIPFDVLFSYQGKDLSKTLQIYNVLRQRVRDDVKLEKLYTQTFIPLSELLYHVELNGFAFNWTAWEENKIRLEQEVKDLKEAINTLVGRELNPGSSQQVCAYVYDELRIRVKGRAKRSSDAKTVALWPEFPFKHALSKWRVANKALSTYVIGMAKHVHDDGRIHPTFLIHGTRTGRLSCRDPNLQNIPRDPLLKAMFMASPGYVLLDLDASQAELRSLAIQSGDPALLAIYNSTDRSLHKETAAYRYGDSYTEDQYVRAKAVNFGVIYGRSAHSLAEEFGISEKQAQKEIDSFWEQFPVAKAFQDKCRNAPRKRQTLTTCFGRKCRPGLVTKENLNGVQNEFANFPHQSTASDITAHTAIRIRPIIAKLGAKIVDLVHDSIVIEVPNDPTIVAMVKRIGIDTFAQVAVDWKLTKVPFVAEAKMCYLWGTPVKELNNGQPNKTVDSSN